MGEQSLDLFEIAPPEKYKEDLLNRIGGKMEFHFIVATLSERIQNDPKLQDFYKTYDLGNLHKYQTHFLNSVFVQMPDSFDLNTRIAETHNQELDAGMNAKQFDALVHLFQAILLEFLVKEKAIEDACRLLEPLRKIFEHNKNNSTSGKDDDSKVELISLEELMAMRKK